MKRLSTITMGETLAVAADLVNATFEPVHANAKTKVNWERHIGRGIISLEVEGRPDNVVDGNRYLQFGIKELQKATFGITDPDGSGENFELMPAATELEAPLVEAMPWAAEIVTPFVAMHGLFVARGLIIRAA